MANFVQMIQKLKIIFILLLMAGPLTSIAQLKKMQYRDRIGDSITIVNTALKPPRIKRPPALKNEFSGGFQLLTNGYGLFVQYGMLHGGDEYGAEYQDKFYQVRLFELELNEIKHSKEIKSQPLFSYNNSQPRNYILGKVNNFYQMNIGFGIRKLIAGKPDPETFSIHWASRGGLSLALLKPYYLDIYGLGEVKYSDSIAQDFISPELIRGKASLAKGLDEIKVIPGLYLKSGLHFDFSGKKKLASALEVGVNGSIYTKKIKQMVNIDPQLYFFGAYVSLQFGKKW